MAYGVGRAPYTPGQKWNGYTKPNDMMCIRNVWAVSLDLGVHQSGLTQIGKPHYMNYMEQHSRWHCWITNVTRGVDSIGFKKYIPIPSIYLKKICIMRCVWPTIYCRTFQIIIKKKQKIFLFSLLRLGMFISDLHKPLLRLFNSSLLKIFCVFFFLLLKNIHLRLVRNVLRLWLVCAPSP